MRKPKKTGDTPLMQDKMRFEHERGTLKSDGRDWSQHDTDMLLNAWFKGVGEKEIADYLGRPTEGLRRKVWGVVTRYKDCDYTPGPWREKRRGPFHKRELESLDDALNGEGSRRTPPVTVEHVALVLGRTVAEVRKHKRLIGLSELRMQRKGFR